MPSTRRRLLVGVVIAAVALIGGRAASVLYADYTWYDALGASPLWRERTGDLVLIYGIGSVIAVLVAFLNLSALGRSIGVLTLPRRLANV
jgi:D-arabinose 1-dehydrogenase-like Zn-dependent alcohol dehydrogenase